MLPLEIMTPHDKFVQRNLQDIAQAQEQRLAEARLAQARQDEIRRLEQQAEAARQMQHNHMQNFNPYNH